MGSQYGINSAGNIRARSLGDLEKEIVTLGAISQRATARMAGRSEIK